jgi:hypothetical protein
MTTMTSATITCSPSCSTTTHSTSPAVGDIHYEMSTGIPTVMIYNGMSWEPTMGSAASGGVHMHVGRDLDGRFTTDEEEDDEDAPLPSRQDYVKRVVRKHKQTHDAWRCMCGAEFQGHHWVEHIATVAIDACDKWDELVMAQVDDDE